MPEGFEFTQRRSLCVKKIKNKSDYVQLLLTANPTKTNIYEYLDNSDMYGLQVGENIVSLAVILRIDSNTLELKDLITEPSYIGKGYSEKLLKSLCGNYKQKYSKMLVGTSEDKIPFYVKQGFDKYEKTIKNYFADINNTEKSNDNLIYTNVYYYSKDLRRK